MYLKQYSNVGIWDHDWHMQHNPLYSIYVDQGNVHSGSLWFNRVEETHLHKEAWSSHALYFLLSHIYYWAIEKSIKSCDQVYSWAPRFNLGDDFFLIFLFLETFRS